MNHGKPHGEQCRNHFYSNSFLSFKNNESDVKISENNTPWASNGAFSLSFINGQSAICKHWNLICQASHSKWGSVVVLFCCWKAKYRRAHKKAPARVQQIFTLSFAQAEQWQLIKNLTLKKYLWNKKPKRRLRLPGSLEIGSFLFAALFIFGFRCAA